MAVRRADGAFHRCPILVTLGCGPADGAEAAPRQRPNRYRRPRVEEPGQCLNAHCRSYDAGDRDASAHKGPDLFRLAASGRFERRPERTLLSFWSFTTVTLLTDILGSGIAMRVRMLVAGKTFAQMRLEHKPGGACTSLESDYVRRTTANACSERDLARSEIHPLCSLAKDGRGRRNGRCRGRVAV